MKYPYVNLLNKSEKRYQGLVDRRFLLFCFVVAPVICGAMFSGIKWLQYSGLKGDLKYSQSSWESLEPKLGLYQSEKKVFDTNARAEELIHAWDSAQVPMSKLLVELQGLVPDNVQLSRLVVRSDPGSSVYENSEDFKLQYSISIQGSAEGDRAEGTVIQLRKSLLKPEVMGATFKSSNLKSMKAVQSKDGKAMRKFILEGSAVKGNAP